MNIFQSELVVKDTGATIKIGGKVSTNRGRYSEKIKRQEFLHKPYMLE